MCTYSTLLYCVLRYDKYIWLCYVMHQQSVHQWLDKKFLLSFSPEPCNKSLSGARVILWVRFILLSSCSLFCMRVEVEKIGGDKELCELKKKGWKWLSHEEWTDKLSSDLIDVTLIWSVMFIIRPMLHSSFTTQKVIYHYRKVSSRGKVTQNNWQKWKWWKCLWIHSESDKNICELRSRPCKL